MTGSEEPEALEETWPEELTDDLDREIDADLQRLATTVRARLLADASTITTSRCDLSNPHRGGVAMTTPPVPHHADTAKG